MMIDVESAAFDWKLQIKSSKIFNWGLWYLIRCHKGEEIIEMATIKMKTKLPFLKVAESVLNKHERSENAAMKIITLQLM